MQINLLTENMQIWLSKSIQSELYASSLYKSLANQNERQGFFGAQKFYLKESADELTHYQKLADFANSMGWCAPIPAIEAVTEVVYSIGTALQISFETELALLRQYQEFYKAAEEEDCITAQFLLQFMEIQRLAVGEYMDLRTRYQRCGMNEAAILEFDEYMGEK